VKAGAFLVLWLGWNCNLGGCRLDVPGAAKPLVCKPVVGREAYETLGEAQRRVDALGPEAGAEVVLVQGVKLYDRPHRWKTEF
jgi:hypothetical protein